MTNEKALEEFKWHKRCAEYKDESYCDCVAVEEVDLAISALEKQVAKKVTWNSEGKCFCPGCNTVLGDEVVYEDRTKYCNVCGQHLDWDKPNWRV